YLEKRLDQALFGPERAPLVGRAPLACSPDTAIYAAFALGEHDDAWGRAESETRHLVVTLATRAEHPSAIDEVLLALAARRAGLENESDRLARRAAERPLTDVTTAALLLRLRAARGEDATQAVRFLLAQRRG